MPVSFPVGRLAGMHLRLHYSWPIVVALLTLTLSLIWYPRTVPHHTAVQYWIAGLLASLLLFLCVLAHELGHILIACTHGLPMRNITLYICGSVSNYEQGSRRAGIELQIAVAGLAVSIFLGAILLPLGIAIGNTEPIVSTTLVYLGVENILLALVNVIPGFPLDGGRVFRALLWSATGSLRTATRWTVWIGEGMGILFFFAGVLGLIRGNVLAGIWLAVVGWFLFSAAVGAGTRQTLETMLRGVPVADVMNPTPVIVPITASLDELVHHYLEPHQLHAAPVAVSDQLLGIVSLTDVRRVPQEQWGSLPVGHMMVPLERIVAVAPDDPLTDAISLMAEASVQQVPVIRGWQLAGILSRAVIARYLQNRRGLSLAEAEQNIADEIELLQRAG